MLREGQGAAQWFPTHMAAVKNSACWCVQKILQYVQTNSAKETAGTFSWYHYARDWEFAKKYKDYLHPSHR
jgi:hypothetical protein